MMSTAAKPEHHGGNLKGHILGLGRGGVVGYIF